MTCMAHPTDFFFRKRGEMTDRCSVSDHRRRRPRGEKFNLFTLCLLALGVGIMARSARWRCDR